MKFYLGVTDINWYNYLSDRRREDINFWQPGGQAGFKALTPGGAFLFKLKYPLNVIGGIGFFSSHSFLPMSIAWDVFGNGNGCDSFKEFYTLISHYRKDKLNQNPTIGCIVLTNPIFFEKADWIATPEDWGRSTVSGKTYSSETESGKRLWFQIEKLLKKYLHREKQELSNQLSLEQNESAYGKSILTKVRLGQSAFRILVTDAYNRKCAISGEKTLPVLEAAHIQQYSAAGPHFISNSLLLRSDLHKLFDSGYLTITREYRVEISKRIKEEFQNGRDYYKYHGENLHSLPSRATDKPNGKFVEWHNENVFRG